MARTQKINPEETTAGTTTQRRGRRTGNRKNITTGLIRPGQVTGLAGITDKNAQLFADALVLACNTAIASNSWGEMQPLDFVNVVVSGYGQMSLRT